MKRMGTMEQGGHKIRNRNNGEDGHTDDGSRFSFMNRRKLKKSKGKDWRMMITEENNG